MSLLSQVSLQITSSTTSNQRHAPSNRAVIMKTFTVLLGISALFPPSLVLAAREPFSFCSNIFPEEPCFRDPEWCYRALESIKNPFGRRDLQPDQNATDGIAVNFDALASCESLAGVDRTAYRRCLAMRNVSDMPFLKVRTES